MSGKQHKRELKREKELARRRAMQAERRRTLITIAIVVTIVVIGGLVIGLTIADDRAELAALATPTPEPTSTATDGTEAPPTGAVVPEDPAAVPGEPSVSGIPAVADDRPVACGAEEPGDVTRSRPTYPGGPAEVLEPGADYRAVIETSCGTVVLDLLEAQAPATVNAFVFLAQQGFFDAQEIFRNATSIGALQTGSGSNENTWGIGYTLPGELAVAGAGGYPPGAVAMANSGTPDSGGSQFFFVYNELFDEAFAANRTYTVFANAVEGMEVLEEIGAIAVEGETPNERTYMESVTIESTPGSAQTGTATTGPETTTATAAPTTAAATPTEESS